MRRKPMLIVNSKECPTRDVVMIMTPVIAIIIPMVFGRFIFSCKNKTDRMTVKMGEKEISHPAEDALMVNNAVA